MQPDQGSEFIKLSVNKVFTFSMIWGLGGNLIHTKHEEFDQFVRGIIGNMCQVPSLGSVFDVFVDVSSNPVELRCWNDYVPTFAYDKTVSFHSMLVPTADTCRCVDLALCSSSCNRNQLHRIRRSKCANVFIMPP